MQIAVEYRISALVKKTDQILSTLLKNPDMIDAEEDLKFPLRTLDDRKALVERIQDNNVMEKLLVGRILFVSHPV